MYKTKFRANKYGSTKTGLGFPSKLEESVYRYLSGKVDIGLIRDLKRQQTIVLQDGPRDTKITWKVDFSFIQNSDDQLVFAEAKGFETEVYRLKLKLYRKLATNKLEIYKGRHNDIQLAEVIDRKQPSKTGG